MTNYLNMNNEKAIAIKELPDPKQKMIFPPDMDYFYFNDAHDFPFKPKAKEYSAVNAWWMAECSFLAYAHPGFARLAYRIAGFADFRFFGGKSTECMVAWNKTCVIVSFRGTEIGSVSTLREIFTDLDTASVPFPKGGRVHRGFLNALNEIWEGENGLLKFLDDLLSLNPKRPLWFTGHSLGGALASLAFTYIPTAAGLYVFGSPRLGDPDFVKLCRNRQVWRVENAKDPIVLIPPDVPKLKLNYQHLGTLVYLDDEGEVHSDRPILNIEEMKHKARKSAGRQLFRFSKIFTKSKQNGQSLGARAREAYNEFGEHINRSVMEWRDYLNSIDHKAGIHLEDHMPVFYCVKLWNLLYKSRIRED
ncbi:MAG: lipase family protein [Spirochaetales bacterium]|nr:lipase family protein [Spirochaetales bacterium]